MLDAKYLVMYEKERIPFWSMLFLIFIYEEDFDTIDVIYNENFMDYSQHVQILETRGYIKKFGRNPTDITMRKIGEDLFKKYIGTKSKVKRGDSVKYWIEEWRELFPAGVNSGGYRYRGDKKEVLKKMIKFVDSNDYTKEEIFKATKNYVERFSLRGYNYMQMAHYFIEKQGAGSTLSSECEGLREKKEHTKDEDRGYGRKII